jgi:hypothetical protein
MTPCPQTARIVKHARVHHASAFVCRGSPHLVFSPTPDHLFCIVVSRLICFALFLLFITHPTSRVSLSANIHDFLSNVLLQVVEAFRGHLHHFIIAALALRVKRRRRRQFMRSNSAAPQLALAAAAGNIRRLLPLSSTLTHAAISPSSATFLQAPVSLLSSANFLTPSPATQRILRLQSSRLLWANLRLRPSH